MNSKLNFWTILLFLSIFSFFCDVHSQPIFFSRMGLGKKPKRKEFAKEVHPSHTPENMGYRA